MRERAPTGIRPIAGTLRKQFAVDVLASRPKGVLYVGMTSNLAGRVWQHREGMVEGFTKRYWVRFLVYYDFHPSAAEAIAREKLLKRWKRQWKIELIESRNPNWRDLWAEIAVP